MAINPVTLNALLQTSALQSIGGTVGRPAGTLLQQIASTEVSLSTLGRLRSTVAGVADAAAGLQASAQVGSSEALRAGLERFVSSVNAGNRVVDETVFSRLAFGGSALVDDSAGLLASFQLLRGVGDSARNGGVDVAALGLRSEADGRLSFDAAAFDAAFARDPEQLAGAVATLGESVAGSAGQELAAGGSLDARTVSFNLLLASLQADQTSTAFGVGGSAGDSLAGLPLVANPFLFAGAAAFRLISSL